MTEKVIVGYKTVLDNMKSKNGECIWELGKWKKHDGEIKICEAGFHASENPLDVLNNYVYGNRFFVVEARGKIIKEDDKFVASEMRLKSEVDFKKLSVAFAIDCAKQILPLFEKKFPDDKRPRRAIEASEKWLAAGAARAAEAAARTAASDAAWAAWATANAAWAAANAARAAANAAWAAAGATANTAAGAAANAASWAATAASDVAWAAWATADAAADAAEEAAERKRQAKKLLELIKKYTIKKAKRRID